MAFVIELALEAAKPSEACCLAALAAGELGLSPRAASERASDFCVFAKALPAAAEASPAIFSP